MRSQQYANLSVLGNWVMWVGHKIHWSSSGYQITGAWVEGPLTDCIPIFNVLIGARVDYCSNFGSYGVAQSSADWNVYFWPWPFPIGTTHLYVGAQFGPSDTYFTNVWYGGAGGYGQYVEAGY